MTRLLLMFFLTAALSMIRASNPEDSSKIEDAAVAKIQVEGYPDFLEIGFDSLWVSNEGVGAVQRIDARSNKMIAEVKVNDPKTNQVVKRYGPAQGSGAVRAGNGSVWVSAHDTNKVWRLDTRR